MLYKKYLHLPDCSTVCGMAMKFFTSNQLLGCRPITACQHFKNTSGSALWRTVMHPNNYVKCIFALKNLMYGPRTLIALQPLTSSLVLCRHSSLVHCPHFLGSLVTPLPCSLVITLPCSLVVTLPWSSVITLPWSLVVTLPWSSVITLPWSSVVTLHWSSVVGLCWS